MTTAASTKSLAVPGRPPAVLRVVGFDDAGPYRAPVDWTEWYLTDEEDMSQSPEQHAIISVLEPSLRHLLAERGRPDLFVGGDAFFAWLEREPLVRVSPDVYVMLRPPGEGFPRMWETWRAGIEPPLLAIEIVSADWRKDYRLNPPKYASLRAEELIVFDPGAPEGHPERVPLQVYRETEDGLFVAAYAGDGPARSLSLDVWVVVQPTPEGPRARLAYDAHGHDLVPTDSERAARAQEEAVQAQEEAVQAREQAAQAREQAAQARSRAESAERRNAELLAELERLRAAGSPSEG